MRLEPLLPLSCRQRRRFGRGSTSSTSSRCSSEDRPDARRVPATEQDPLRSEPGRRHYQGDSRGSLPTVRPIETSAYPLLRSLTSIYRYPNLTEVRTIPGRKNIAFVEFADEASSGVARDALHNTKYGEGDASLKLKVTFAKHG